MSNDVAFLPSFDVLDELEKRIVSMLESVLVDCLRTYGANEPKDAEAEDQRIIGFSIVIGYTDASVLEKVALPAIQSMCCRTNIKQNNLRKAFNQPIAGDDLSNLLIRNQRNLPVDRDSSHESHAVSCCSPCLEWHRFSIRSLPLPSSRTSRCRDRYRCNCCRTLSS